MYVVDSNNGTSMYNLSCIACFKCFLIVSVYCISYRCFQRQKFIKLVVFIVYVDQKEKLVLCENLVSLISLRSWYVLCWDDGLIIPFVWMRLTSQPCRCCSFGCRYTWGRRRSNCVVFEILRLKPTATVVMGWTMCPLFCYVLYMACDVCVMHYFVLMVIL
jgi:hypothetical protein